MHSTQPIISPFLAGLRLPRADQNKSQTKPFYTKLTRYEVIRPPLIALVGKKVIRGLRLWPLTAVAVGGTLTAAWVSLLGYEAVRLFEIAL